MTTTHHSLSLSLSRSLSSVRQATNVKTLLPPVLDVHDPQQQTGRHSFTHSATRDGEEECVCVGKEGRNTQGEERA